MQADKLVDQAGLAHPGLPDDCHDLAVTGTCPFECLAHGLDLHLPSDETGQPPGRQRLQTRLDRPGTDQLKYLHRVR